MASGSYEKTLVLDVGGVLLVDPLASVFDQLAEASVRTRDEIVQFYSRNLRIGLWTGSMAENDFWIRVLGFCGLQAEIDGWRSRLLVAMSPLPAMKFLEEWCMRVEVWLLTNHRTEWLRPVLAKHFDLALISTWLVSSETGRAKPDLDAFRETAILLGSRRRSALFVDDKPEHVSLANSVGISGIEAHGDWVSKVEQWIDSS